MKKKKEKISKKFILTKKKQLENLFYKSEAKKINMKSL